MCLKTGSRSRVCSTALSLLGFRWWIVSFLLAVTHRHHEVGISFWCTQCCEVQISRYCTSLQEAVTPDMSHEHALSSLHRHSQRRLPLKASRTSCGAPVILRSHRVHSCGLERRSTECDRAPSSLTWDITALSPDFSERTMLRCALIVRTILCINNKCAVTFKNLLIDLFLAVLGLHCWAQAFSILAMRGDYSLFWSTGFSFCSTQAQ